MSPITTGAFGAGLLVGVIVTSAAKTVALLALPAGGLLIAGTLYWKRKRSKTA